MRRQLAAAERVIVALDVPTGSQALKLARRLTGIVRTLKVGSALFTACGPSVVQRLRALRFHVMLDLKFFDIPNTVEQSCRAAVRHRVAMLTVHASGSGAMLRAAVLGARTEARRLGVPRPLVLGVTVLTSTADGGPSRVTAEVVRLARVAQQAGCDGVVASAHEVRALRRRFGGRLWIACPGIRPRSTSRDDQRRVATPAAAVKEGADFLVIGRPITASRNPRKAAQDILEEMEAVDAC
ncbi:MAG: orotidine-5'-phosphate decarboxylase [Candidatus Omnitrophica bacterium]|nr:orotidine-5'-phosphate decarboxylase [Candidatus Omnitrophota bacterium]